MSAHVREIAPELEPQSFPAPRFLPLSTISVRVTAPPHTDGRAVFGVISNMSETGVCVITNRSLPVNAEARIQIESDLAQTCLEISARVVWCAERMEPVREIVGHLTGFAFDPKAVDSVRQLLRGGLFQLVP